MSTLSESASTALQLTLSYDPVLWTIVGRSLSVSATACLVACGVGLWRLRSWARSPVIVVQLIVLLTAWGFVGGETTPVAVVLAAVSVATLVCLLHPRSIRALDAGV